MQQVKSLCDEHDRKAAAELIATNKGLHLTDAIAVINKQISDNIQSRLQKSQKGFLEIHALSNNLAFAGIGISMLLIILAFYFLVREIRKTRKIRDELLFRKENYRVTLNSLGEAMISTDREGLIQYMNPADEKLPVV